MRVCHESGCSVKLFFPMRDGTLAETCTEKQTKNLPRDGMLSGDFEVFTFPSVDCFLLEKSSTTRDALGWNNKKVPRVGVLAGCV